MPPPQLPSALPPSAAHPAEHRVRTLLAGEKWRQARDELKALVKADRARFLPLLISANVGLARKMLAGGQAAEARQVLVYLATIAPPAELRALELELALRSETPEQSLPKFLAALADPVAPLAEQERLQLADLLVLGFEPLPAATPAQTRLAAEVRAIHDALRALAERRWPALSESLRLVSHRSAVSHWVVFLKGVAAFHADEGDRAAKHFRALPSRSAPTRAAAPYLALIGEASPAVPPPAAPAADAPSGAPPLTEAVVGQIGRLIGAIGVSGTLLRADRLWREGATAESYRLVREAAPSFPSLDSDWVGALTGFYFKAPHGMTGGSRTKFLDMFDGLLVARRWKNPVESMLAYRMFALVDAAGAPVEILRKDWECYLVGRRDLRGGNARLESLAYGWLGEELARSEMRSAPSLYRRPPRLRDPAGAVEVLQKSIALDPSNLAAHLQLCTVHTALKQTSERNRLLDAMTARFPDDKQVLLRAGEGCIERKAFVKGLDYLARARQLDQLDPRIPELTVQAHVQLARQHFQQGRPAKGRQSLAAAEIWLTDQAEDFSRSRWTTRVRQGVMERLWGDAAHAADAEGQARTSAPSPAAHLLFAHLAHRVFTRSAGGESPYLADFKQALRTGRGVGEVARLLRIVAHWSVEAAELRAFEEDKLLASALGAAIERPFTRAEAQDVVERAGHNFNFDRPVQRLVKKVLEGDPLDPAFRLWRLSVARPVMCFSSADRSELQSILDEAVRRHDETTMRRVRPMIRDIDHPPPPPPDPFDPAYDAPGGPVDAGNFDDGDFGDLDGLPPPTPEITAEMLAIIETLKNAPPAVVRELKKKMLPDMPPMIFDALVQLAKDGGPRSKPGRPSSPSNQLDLF